MMQSPINRAGFTLLELLVAMSIGMFMMGMATSAFYYTRKAVSTAESVAAKTSLAQSMLLWVMADKSSAEFPKVDQSRGVFGVVIREFKVPGKKGERSISELAIVDPSMRDDQKDPFIKRTDGFYGGPCDPGDKKDAPLDKVPEGISYIKCLKCDKEYVLTKRSGNTIEAARLNAEILYVPKALP